MITNDVQSAEKSKSPFPIVNGKRTAESQKLLEQKHKITKTRDTMQDFEEGVF